MTYHYDIQLSREIPGGSQILDRPCAVLITPLGAPHAFHHAGIVFAWRTPTVVAIKSPDYNIETQWGEYRRGVFEIWIDGVKQTFEIRAVVRTSAQGFAPRTRPTSVPQGTRLDQVVEDIPWRNKSFHFGAGIDAITGSVSGTAVRPFDVIPAKSGNSSERYLFIEDESTMKQEIEASASGKYNIEGVTVSASTEYLQSLDYSETTTTLVASYSFESDENEVAHSYELTDAAKGLLSQPGQFREAYGDYFIAGGLRGARFLATYVCRAATKKAMDEFKASLGADAPAVFSAEGSARFMKAAQESHVEYEVQVYMVGEDPKKPYPTPSNWTPADVIPALAWFKANQVGTILKTELRHYSTVVNTYPRTIDVDPDTFVELRLLYLDLWEGRSRYSALPKYYRDQFRQSFEALDTGISSNQQRLATDRDLLERYKDDLGNLLKDFQDVFSRMDFYFRVLSAVAAEPPKDKEIFEGDGQQTWQYGYSSDPLSNAVSIKTQSIPFKADSDHLHYKEKTIEVSTPNSIIVGWKATSNWTDGTGGGFWKTMDRILLTDKASVHFKSLWARGCDWRLDVYYVDAKDYVFDRDDAEQTAA